MNGELTHHLGYEKHDSAGNNSGDLRNGTTPKIIKGKRGQIEIEVPRDRNGDFEPQLVKKNQRRFDSLDEKIISRIRHRSARCGSASQRLRQAFLMSLFNNLKKGEKGWIF